MYTAASPPGRELENPRMGNGVLTLLASRCGGAWLLSLPISSLQGTRPTPGGSTIGRLHHVMGTTTESLIRSGVKT